MPQSRRHERPRSSCSQHSNPGGANWLSSGSVAPMLAAASIKVMDALFGLVAQNDAERYRRELLGRTWRRDWGMHEFRPKNTFWRTAKIYWDWMLGGMIQTKRRIKHPTHPEHPIHKKTSGTGKIFRIRKIVENCACPNLDAKSVPEALVYTVLQHFAQLSRI